MQERSAPAENDPENRGMRTAGAAAREDGHGSYRLCLDPAYVQWRAEFVLFEARCFGGVCAFVRAHFDDLLDHYYGEGHESMSDFPAWTFERYLQDTERTGPGQGVR